MIKAVERKKNPKHSLQSHFREKKKGIKEKTRQRFTNQHHGKQKRMKQIHHKKIDSALINTCRRGGFAIYPSCQSPLFKSSLVQSSASQSLLSFTHTRTHTTETGCPLRSVTGPNYLQDWDQRPRYTLSEWLG